MRCSTRAKARSTWASFAATGITITAVSDEAVTSISSAVDLMRKYTSNGSSLLAIGDGREGLRKISDRLARRQLDAGAKRESSNGSLRGLRCLRRSVLASRSVDDLGCVGAGLSSSLGSGNQKNLRPKLIEILRGNLVDKDITRKLN